MVNNPLKVSLFLMRLSVFLVFLVWAMDKFLNPEHTSKVFQHFYFSPEFGPGVSYAIGAVQMVLILGFLIGVKKTLTYGAVLIMHLVSTAASYTVYLEPWKSPNILFWAAFPMLAACYALFVLRREDTFLSAG